MGLQGIACGKSTVTKHLEEVKGIKVVDCDKIAREVVLPGGACYNKIVKTWGQDVVLDDGSGLNRKKLGDIIFKNPEESKKLGAIMGPAIFLEISKEIFWQFVRGTPVVVIDGESCYFVSEFFSRPDSDCGSCAHV